MTATWLGAERIELGTCASTNDEAARLAKEGAVHGTVVTAQTQTAGRGRGGHTWFSPDAGNLYLSAILRPQLEPRHVPPITLAAGIGVCDAVNSFGPRPSLKWPNDVLIGRRKVSGILTEMSTRSGATEHVVLGIGVNVNRTDFPPELDDAATSVALEAGRAAIDRERFLGVLLGTLARWLDRFFAGGIDAISAHWTERANFAGRRVRVHLDGARPIDGAASGLDADGALLVVDDTGRSHRVIAGDVEVLGEVDVTRKAALIGLAVAVLGALVGLAILSAGGGDAEPRSSSGEAVEAVAPEPRPTPAIAQPRRVATRSVPDEVEVEADGDVDVDEDSEPGRRVDDDGRLVADHRGKGPPEGVTRSQISGRAGAALRIQLRPEVDACADALTDREAASGASFSVTMKVSARGGQYVIESPSVASRALAEKPFFACVEDRLDGLAVSAPEGQESAESQRLTFPYRVP